MSVAAALPIAEIEASAGLAAHYFVLMRSELYNPYAPESLAGIARLADLGHRVGLHFDASLYPNGAETLDAAVRNECSVLEAMTGLQVEVASFHRPAPTLLDRTEPIAGRLHSYQPRFFREIGYVSDSRGAWHHGHPLEHPAVQAGRALQMLTHPIWWTTGRSATPLETLDRYVADKDARLRRELAANCETYRDRAQVAP